MDRLERTLPILQGLLANPQMAGLNGVLGSPAGIYLLDNAESRKALIFRAIVIADEAEHLCREITEAE